MDNNVRTFNIDSLKYNLSRPTYPVEIFNFLSQQVQNRDSAWDCACGTGQVAYSLVDYFSMIYASDININQIDNRFQHERIKYSVQNSEKTDFQDHFFDLVCVGQALHWFDLGKFFYEVDRILKPNGVFACWGYSFFKINSKIDHLINETVLKPINPYWSEKNYILWDQYKSIKFPFKKIRSPHFEMIQEWTKEELLAYLKTWSTYKRFVQEKGQDVEKKYYKTLADEWPQNVKKKIIMEFTFYSGRKKI